MSRTLQTIALDLELTAEAFATWEGLDSLPRSSTAVAWDLASPTVADGRAGWTVDGGEVLVARARLLLGGTGYVTDTAWDIDAHGERWARTPMISPAAVRAWQAVELWTSTPANTSILFRVWDGSAFKWWNGAAWATATATAHWNTKADLTLHLPSWSTLSRKLAIVAWLKTATTTATPEFYGCRIGFGIRELDGDEGDAVVRTFLSSLRDEIRAFGMQQQTIKAAEVALVKIAPEFNFDVRSVDVAFDMTADPNELAPLAGTFTAGTPDTNPPVPATWAPTVALVAGHVLRLEFSHLPHVVAQAGQDVTPIERLPAIYIGVGSDSSTDRGQGETLIRDLTVNPPIAHALPAPRTITTALDVRVIAEAVTDVRRIMKRLEAWIGGSGYRTAVSPQSARLIKVAEVDAFRSTTDTLSSGTPEARALWRLTFHASTGPSLITRPLVRPDGVIATLTE